MNILRRLPLYRLLLLCGVALAAGIGATALAFALGAGPVPPAKPLAKAVHDALAGPAPEGLSANVQLTDHLLEGASLASEAGGPGGGGGLSSSPLITGGSGRLWISKNALRLELQSESGDTQITWNGHTFELYDAADDTLYRYTPPKNEGGEAEGGAAEGGAGEGGAGEGEHEHAGAPSLARIEEAIAHLERHVDLSGATPTDVGGQAAYTVRLAPHESGSLFGAAELSFDADNGVPLRAALYSSDSSSPVLELAMSEVSFGAVESSVFELTPPAGAKVEELKLATTHKQRARAHGTARARKAHTGRGAPKLTVHGKGPAAIVVLETKAHGKGGESESLKSLPEVKIGGTRARELRTELGTLLTFQRDGVRYLLAGSVEPGALEALARGL